MNNTPGTVSSTLVCQCVHDVIDTAFVNSSCVCFATAVEGAVPHPHSCRCARNRCLHRGAGCVQTFNAL